MAITTYSQLTDELVRQHGTVRALLARMPGTRGNDRRDAFRTLRNSLAVHESLEQAVLRPRLHDGEEALSRTTEEEHLGGLLQELEGLALDSAAFDTALAELTVQIEAHARAEEALEFPRAEGELDEVQRHQVLEALGLVGLPDFTLGNTFAEMQRAARSRLMEAIPPRRDS